MGNFHDPNQCSACELYEDCISKDCARRNRGYENLGHYLYASALYLADTSADAQDLVQITLEKVYRYIEKVRSSEAFKTWAQTILRNEFLRRCRKEPDDQELLDNVSDKSSFQRAESSDEATECLFNASLGRKAKWAWIGRYYYGIRPDQDLADIENLLCETSVRDSTYPSIRARTREEWIKMGLVEVWLEAEFWPADPNEDDALDPTNDDHVALQKSLQQLLITKEWRLLYDAPLDKGSLWAWIGLYVHEMSDKDLARVENLLCNSAIDSEIMSERCRNTWQILKTYLSKL